MLLKNAFLKRSATAWFIVAIVGARVTMGILFSITGPTLMILAENVYSTVSKTSWVFAGRKSFNILPPRCRNFKCDVMWLNNELISGLFAYFRNFFWPSFINLRFFSNSKILNVLKRSVGFYIGAFLSYFSLKSLKFLKRVKFF